MWRPFLLLSLMSNRGAAGGVRLRWSRKSIINYYALTYINFSQSRIEQVSSFLMATCFFFRSMFYYFYINSEFHESVDKYKSDARLGEMNEVICLKLSGWTKVVLPLPNLYFIYSFLLQCNSKLNPFGWLILSTFSLGSAQICYFLDFFCCFIWQMQFKTLMMDEMLNGIHVFAILFLAV